MGFKKENHISKDMKELPKAEPKLKCECPTEAESNALASMIGYEAEEIGRVHEPNKCPCTYKVFKYKRSGDQKDLENRRGVCFYEKDCHPLIALPAYPKTAQEIGTLAHEAVHAIEDIFVKVQENPQGEIFAHSVGAVVRRVMEAK